MQGVPPEVRAANEIASDALVGGALVVASASAFGAMAIMARIAFASGVDTPTLLALRFSIAAVAIFVIARVRGVPLPRGQLLVACALLGALGYGGQAFSYFTALTLAPAGVVALLLYLYPAAVALLAATFLHDRLTPAKITALVLALAGLALTVGPAVSGSAKAATPPGIAFAIAAAVIYAIYIVVSARVARQIAPLALASVVIASAAVVFDVAAALHGPRWPGTTGGWLAIAGIAIVSTVAAITLFFAGLARIGPTRASTLSTVEPLVTIALAAIVLGETIAPVQFAGGALILAAVILLARATR